MLGPQMFGEQNHTLYVTDNDSNQIKKKWITPITKTSETFSE